MEVLGSQSVCGVLRDPWSWLRCRAEWAIYDYDSIEAACIGVARGASSGGRDVGRVVGLRGVSVASAVCLARREFGATGFWNRDALVALAGRVLGLPACVGDG